VHEPSLNLDNCSPDLMYMFLTFHCINYFLEAYVHHSQHSLETIAHLLAAKVVNIKP
jgi:hypothetical protein